MKFLKTITRQAVDGPRLYKAIGDLILTARTRKHMTQVDLAVRVGLTRTSITNIEAGKQRVAIETLYEIALALRVPVGSLLP